jgi:RNA polymerase sigma factor (sigma-70 family)
MDDHQLVKDCLKGKAAAQKELYHLFAGSMLGICYRYTKSMVDAEDVLQEGFVKVFKSLHQYKFEGELGGWIRRIMVNTAINYLKKNSRYQTELLFTDDQLHAVVEDHPEVRMSAKELSELIRQLPTGYQTIFILLIQAPSSPSYIYWCRFLNTFTKPSCNTSSASAIDLVYR